MEQNIERKWEHAVALTTNKYDNGGAVKLRLDIRGFVQQLRINTNKGEITYKPSKKGTKTSEVAGIETTQNSREAYTVAEFLELHPWIKKLNNDSKIGEATFIGSYCVMTVEENEDVNTYKFFTPGLFELVYYEPVHSKDKSRLEEMQKLKQKYTEVEP